MVSVSAASMPPTGVATTITVTGTNFVRSSAVNWNGGVRPTTYISNTQLSAALSAKDVSVGGTAQVLVTTPAPGGGTASAQSVKLEYPLPTITSLSPATSTWNSTRAFTLTVNGAGFYPGALVLWNGISRVTTFVSNTQLSASILAGDITTGNTEPTT